jgi:hypothetical protein
MRKTAEYDADSSDAHAIMFLARVCGATKNDCGEETS